MTRPKTYLIRMLVFLVAVLLLTVLLSGALITAFSSNPLLNGLIFVVLLIGVGWNLLQVTRLAPEVTWLETFQQSRSRVATLFFHRRRRLRRQHQDRHAFVSRQSTNGLDECNPVHSGHILIRENQVGLVGLCLHEALLAVACFDYAIAVAAQDVGEHLAD